MFVNYCGTLYPSDKPVLNPANRSFLYGDGLFESMRMINGKILFLENHLERLKKGAAFLHLNIPSFFNVPFFENQINELAAKNHIQDNARVRLNVFRNEGGFYAPDENNSGWLLSLVNTSEDHYVLNSSGLHIDIFSEIKKPVNKLSSFKTCNALIYVLAGIWKITQNLDEVLILNEDGRICEGFNANIFIVKKGKFITTPVTEGCIEGVMRNQIISIIKNKNFEFSEDKIEISDLNSSDEIFLSNASMGIRWIGAFRNKRYFCRYSKEIINSLNSFIKNEF